MFIQGINTLSSVYNTRRTSFKGGNPGPITKAINKGADEFIAAGKKAEENLTEHLTDAQREAIRKAGYDSEPDIDSSNLSFFSNDF